MHLQLTSSKLSPHNFLFLPWGCTCTHCTPWLYLCINLCWRPPFKISGSAPVMQRFVIRMPSYRGHRTEWLTVLNKVENIYCTLCSMLQDFYTPFVATRNKCRLNQYQKLHTQSVIYKKILSSYAVDFFHINCTGT